MDHFWLVKRQDADAQAALRAKLLELPTEAWHCQLNMQQLWIFGPPEGLKTSTWLAGKSPTFFVGNTSSKGCISIVIFGFRGGVY